MAKNMGAVDRTFRIIVGFVIIGLGFAYQSWWGLIGVVPLLTAFTGFCPMYLPFGISTFHRHRAHHT